MTMRKLDCEAVRRGWRRAIMCLSVTGVLLACSATAAADPLPSPIRASSADMESVTFARLVLRIRGTNGIAIAGDELRVKFLEMLRANGYPALGAESLVFGQDSSDGARFAIGGTITELECAAEGTSTRRCRLGVEWEVLDRANERVVYRVTTRHLASGVDPHHLGNTLVGGAFIRLLSRQRFVHALKKRPEAAASTSHPKAVIKLCQNPAIAMPAGAEKALEATVVVSVGDHLGSGVIVSPDGIVLTAAHVVAGAEPPKVQTRSGQQYAAVVVRSQPKTDVALLKLEAPGKTPCLAHRADPVRVGEEVYAIGSPLGKTLSFSLTRGIVSGFREIDGVSLLQTDASVNRGNSGGPLVDATGKWTGITTWKAAGGGVEGIAFGVPTRSALDGLSLEPGDHTDPLLLRAADTISPPEPRRPVQDSADPIRPLFEPPPAVEAVVDFDKKPEAPRTDESRILELVGWAGAGVGVLGAFSTYGYYKSKEGSITPDGFERARSLNDVSWALVGLGMATVGIAYLLPRQENPHASASARKSTRQTVSWSGGIGPGSVVMQLRY